MGAGWGLSRMTTGEWVAPDVPVTYPRISMSLELIAPDWEAIEHAERDPQGRQASRAGLGVTDVHGAQTDPMARRRRGIPVVLNEALGGNIGRSSPWARIPASPQSVRSRASGSFS